jgi:limonene-1,2-epoxide hydrolase
MAALSADTLDGLFSAIDAKDTDAFLAYLAEDGVFQYGAAPVARGREQVRAAVDGFFSSIDGLSHELTNVFPGDGAMACEGRVTYRRHDGSEITLPFCNVFILDEDRIAEYRVYIDIAPLYA